MFLEVTITILLIPFVTVFTIPPFVMLLLYFKDKNQKQHSVFRNFPLLGRVRYVFEMVGSELRQYMFDGDNKGKRTV
jgi:hypothetical protein